ncbi:MAG: AAA family ATPase [Patescibacteria group bacterium]|nr:AAA family ATPase [Patescibacteria group bacterium]
MSQIISFVNQKGGVGKTTSAVNIASYLAYFGKKVLLIDLDPQGNATSGLGIAKEKLAKNVYDVLCGRVNLKEILYQGLQPTLHIAPASPDLAGAAVELVSLPDREFLLKKVLTPLKGDYDYVMIDSPPSLGILTVNALTAADSVVIPVQCEYYALEGLSQLLYTIDLVQKNLNPGLNILGVVLTMRDKKTRIANDVVREVQRNFPGKVFETIVPRNVRLAEAPSFGQAILNYEPLCKGARAYKHLAQEIISLNNE